MQVQEQVVAGVAECTLAARQRLTRSAHEFEAQMMKELLQPVCRRDDGREEAGYGASLTEFAAEALGGAISLAGGFGIADRIVAQIFQNTTHCNVGPAMGKTEAIRVR